MHAAFMDRPYVLFFEEASYEAKLSEVIGRLREETSVPTEPLLSPWCSSDSLNDE